MSTKIIIIKVFNIASRLNGLVVMNHIWYDKRQQSGQFLLFSPGSCDCTTTRIRTLSQWARPAPAPWAGSSEGHPKIGFNCAFHSHGGCSNTLQRFISPTAKTSGRTHTCAPRYTSVLLVCAFSVHYVLHSVFTRIWVLSYFITNVAISAIQLKPNLWCHIIIIIIMFIMTMSSMASIFLVN